MINHAMHVLASPHGRFAMTNHHLFTPYAGLIVELIAAISYVSHDL